MKEILKRIISLAFFLFISQTNAQNIVPVEKAIDYVKAGNGIPTGTYLKDVSNLLSPYLGTWKGTIDNKTYTFFISKITESSNGRTTDKLVIYHVVFDNKQDHIIEDTRTSKARAHMRGWFFSDDLKTYSLHYIGENSQCGRYGQVSIRITDETTMSLILSPRGDVVDIKSCPDSKIAEQILPTETPVTLIKQS